MTDQTSASWMFRLLVFLASTAALILTMLFVEVVLGVNLPRYFAYWLAIIVGAASSLFWRRKKLLTDSDPYSPEVRARSTARLISDSDRG